MSNSQEVQANQLPIIWGALTFSHLVYLVMASLVVKEVNPEVEMLGTLLMGIGMMNIAMALFVMPKLLSDRSKDGINNLCIIQWAIIESGAILGFVSYFLTGLKMPLYVLVALSVSAMMLVFPSKKRLDELAKQ